jgi:hypothetical protein
MATNRRQQQQKQQQLHSCTELSNSCVLLRHCFCWHNMTMLQFQDHPVALVGWVMVGSPVLQQRK